MTIHDALKSYYSANYKGYKGEIGLEIETETPSAYKVPKFSFWNTHADGSLRQFGQEYVLKAPVMYETELDAALDEFKDKTKDFPFIQDSITTSVHVHLNILNEKFATLGNFLTIYSLVENLLVRFSGDDRRSNLFSLPICDAEEIFNNIVRLIRGIGSRSYGQLDFQPEYAKYGALNLSAIVRYGSLEIRSFRGTTDTALIHQWITMLYSIMQYAKQEKLYPPQIIMAYKDKGPELLSDIFGKNRSVIKLDNEVDLIEKNFWYSANIANAINNWDKLDIEPKTKKVKSNDLERLAIQMFNQTFENLTYDQQYAVLNTTITDGGIATEEAQRILQRIQEAERGRQRTVYTGMTRPVEPFPFATNGTIEETEENEWMEPDEDQEEEEEE